MTPRGTLTGYLITASFQSALPMVRTHVTELVGTRFRAVQQDVAVTVVDWPVTHAWSESDPDFVGAVTVMDEAGAQLATADWQAPTDQAAEPFAEPNRVAAGRTVGTGLAGPADGAGGPPAVIRAPVIGRVVDLGETPAARR